MMTIVAIAKNDKLQTLDEEEDECIRDYFFEWTEDWNQFFVDNVPWKDFMIIKSSFGIDAMMLSFLLIFFCNIPFVFFAGKIALMAIIHQCFYAKKDASSRASVNEADDEFINQQQNE